MTHSLAYDSYITNRTEQAKQESTERKRRLEQEMDIGLAQEQERLIRMDMERQKKELQVITHKRQPLLHTIYIPNLILLIANGRATNEASRRTKATTRK